MTYLSEILSQTVGEVIVHISYKVAPYLILFHVIVTSIGGNEIIEIFFQFFFVGKGKTRVSGSVNHEIKNSSPNQ